jgi:septum formation protein
MKHRLILASTSPYRREVLSRLGIAFEAISPQCDEAAYAGRPPLELARILARLKATSVSAEGAALVVGSDQVVDLEGRVLGKPGTVENAVAQLMAMSGRAHRLITAVAVMDVASGEVRVDHDIHTLWMRRLSEAEVAAYVAHDMPLDCAGSYKIERRGISLFERIEADPTTADDTAIMGLPLMKTLALLRGFGWDPLSLET